MAIGRISGPMLFSNLERQGIDLAFESNLVYLDVTNGRVGIVNSSPQYSLDASGNVKVSNIIIQGNTISSNTGRVNLGSIANVVITGGGTEFVLYTDGLGNLSFSNIQNLSVISSIISNVAAANVEIGQLQANIAAANVHIDTIDANLGAITSNITTLFGNATSQQSNIDAINANVASANIQIANIEAALTNSSGNIIILGTPVDTSLTANAAYDGWTTATYVTDAIDNLNQVALNVGQQTFVGNVQLTANIIAGPSPLTVRFTGTSSGWPNSYYWDFGDGTTSTNSNTVISSSIDGSRITNSVTKTYTNVLGGQFTVYHRAFNSNGTWYGNASLGAIGSVDDATIVNYITLYTPNPIPTFTANVSSLNSSGTLLLTDTSQYATSYIIYWGDGTISSNLAIAGNQRHTYVNSGGDTIYSIILQGNSTTAGPNLVTVNSAATSTKVYSTHTPAITANVVRVVNWEGNSGGYVRFTNGTATNPGAASTFGAQQVYQYWWSDVTTAGASGANSNVAVGVGTTGSGDTSQYIDHLYVLSNTAQAAGTTVTYDTQLRVYNGHTSSPFSSTNVSIIVEPSVRSNINARANITSDRTGDTALTGYIFTDYNNHDRALFTFSTAAQNTTTYNWGWGDGTATGNLSEGAAGTVTGGNVTHVYTSTGTKTANLTAYGTPGTLFQTNSKSKSITISTNPAAPGNLSSKTLSLSTASVGTSPYMAAGASDNTGGNIAANGTSVTRYTTSTTWANTAAITAANSSVSGSLTAVFNAVDNGNVSFSTTTDTTGTYTTLRITQDADARTAISAATYPSGFYKVFSALAAKSLTSVSLGYNDITLTHNFAGNTNTVAFVKDDVITVPTLVTSSVTVANVTATAIRYISGLPYYQTGGNVVIQGLQAYSWIGQTYQNTATPMTIAANATLAEGTSGTIISSQTKTYTQLDGSTSYLTASIPKANTGNVIGNSYTFGNIYALINGSAAAVGNVTATLTSVNGSSTTVSLPKLINVYSSAISGFDETSIACSAGTANTQVAKRIVLTSANITTPTYANTGTNYYASTAWTGLQTIEGTTEAVVRWGNLKPNTNNYNNYLPVGPNLAVGGDRTSTQNFKLAFQRPAMQNFKVIFTGRVAGMFIAAPGTKLTDTSSTLNGWADANVAYSGAGIPGANTGAGGNGGVGCAVGTTVPTSTFVSNVSYTLTLGGVNLSQSSTNNLLLNVVLGPNDFVSNLYIGSA